MARYVWRKGRCYRKLAGGKLRLVKSKFCGRRSLRSKRPVYRDEEGRFARRNWDDHMRQKSRRRGSIIYSGGQIHPEVVLEHRRSGFRAPSAGGCLHTVLGRRVDVDCFQYHDDKVCIARDVSPREAERAAHACGMRAEPSGRSPSHPQGPREFTFYGEF